MDPEEFAKRIIEEAKKEAQKILEEAQKEAQKIIEEAQKEAEAIRRERERELDNLYKMALSRIIGKERRKARLEISLKRRELVDKALERGLEKARERLNRDILSRRLQEALKGFDSIKRIKLEAPEALRDEASKLGIPIEAKEINGFRLISEDIEVEDTLETRLERRRKKLEAIASESLLGRRVKL